MTINVQSPFFIAVFSAIVMIGWGIVNQIQNRKYNHAKSIKIALDNKVDISDCVAKHEAMQRFKIRIGEESDNHSKNITKLEKALIWIVKEMGGKPEELGLM